MRANDVGWPIRCDRTRQEGRYCIFELWIVVYFWFQNKYILFNTRLQFRCGTFVQDIPSVEDKGALAKPLLTANSWPPVLGCTHFWAQHTIFGSRQCCAAQSFQIKCTQDRSPELSAFLQMASLSPTEVSHHISAHSGKTKVEKFREDPGGKSVLKWALPEVCCQICTQLQAMLFQQMLLVEI